MSTTKTSLRRELEGRLDLMLTGKIPPPRPWEEVVLWSFLLDRPDCPAKTFDQLIEYLEERPEILLPQLHAAANLILCF